MESQTPASSNTASEQYDSAYYDRYIEDFKTPDPLRPVRRSLRRAFYFLPTTRSVCVFAFGHPKDFRKWRSWFSPAYGYEVNPRSILEAQRLGLTNHVALQDVTVPFTPLFPATVSVCSYLFEHLTDEQIFLTSRNMRDHSPLNVIRLTMFDDPHYHTDPTHLNPRLRPSWNSLLVSVYNQLGYKRIAAEGQTWAFASEALVESLNGIQRNVAYQVDKAWASHTVTHPSPAA